MSCGNEFVVIVHFFYTPSDRVTRTCEGSYTRPIVRAPSIRTYAVRDGTITVRGVQCSRDWSGGRGGRRRHDGTASHARVLARSASGGGPTHILVYTQLLVPGVRVRSYASQNPQWADGVEVSTARRRRVQLASTSR